MRIARHCIEGWDSPVLAQDYRAAAELLGLSVEAVRDKVRKLEESDPPEQPDAAGECAGDERGIDLREADECRAGARPEGEGQPVVAGQAKASAAHLS